MVSTKYRSDAPEIMDDFSMEGEILRDALDKIATINQLLGGNKVTLQGVRQLLKDVPKERNIHIIDVGCGNGDMLRALADYGNKRGLHLQLIGIDANAFTINYGRSLSKNYEDISYICEDIFNENFKEVKVDIVLCTLTLHHFKDDEILRLIEAFKSQTRIGIVINDLHRNALAYRLFQAICYIFKLNSMSREDGLVSILRGFKKSELKCFSQKLQLKKYSILWRWAFRYQWIIYNI